MKLNQKNHGDGMELLRRMPLRSTPLIFFDPQYRQGLDKLAYGNEGARMKERAKLPQMSSDDIRTFILLSSWVLKPSGHLFLWADKFMLVENIIPHMLKDNMIELDIVDMITWDKGHIGMGYRSRRASEHLLVLQRPPRRAKGVWTDHTIRDVWYELQPDGHPHAKPVGLIEALIGATTEPGDLVLDPAAGGFGVLKACQALGRNFLGCDIGA